MKSVISIIATVAFLALGCALAASVGANDMPNMNMLGDGAIASAKTYDGDALAAVAYPSMLLRASCTGNAPEVEFSYDVTLTSGPVYTHRPGALVEVRLTSEKLGALSFLTNKFNSSRTNDFAATYVDRDAASAQPLDEAFVVSGAAAAKLASVLETSDGIDVASSNLKYDFVFDLEGTADGIRRALAKCPSF
ncbi:MAG: hypothetical protein KGI75_00915 [Rhizobiaceae bacterium]|nr:hypothetical protein [Rhizobiaceae bacterium]